MKAIIALMLLCSIASANDLRQNIVEIAKAEIGMKEEGGNNKGKIIKRYEGIEGQPWCAAFATWVWRKAGADPLKARLRVQDIVAEASKGRFLKQTPSPGDIALWQRGLPGSGKGHCGIVISAYRDGSFDTIEGNVGDYPAKVRVFRHHVSEEALIGFAEPQINQ